MLLRVDGPGLVPRGELLGKADAEAREVSRAGDLVAEVEQKVHVLDGEDDGGKRLLRPSAVAWLGKIRANYLCGYFKSEYKNVLWTREHEFQYRITGIFCGDLIFAVLQSFFKSKN